MNNKSISVVIPAYNEEKIIISTITSILPVLEAHFESYELIIVDDGSSDNTRALTDEYPSANVKCIGHYPNRGKGCAVREGILAASGDVTVCTDADLAYGVEVIPQIFNTLVKEKKDVILGSRKLHPNGYSDYPPMRKLASHTFSFLTGAIAGFHYDTQCGIKAYDTDCAHKIFSKCTVDGFTYDFEAVSYALQLGCSIGQLPVEIINHRESKVNLIKDSFTMFISVFKIRHSVKSSEKRN